MMFLQLFIFISTIFASSIEYSIKSQISNCDAQSCQDAADLSESCTDDTVLTCICGLNDEFWQKFYQCAKDCNTPHVNEFTEQSLKQNYCKAIGDYYGTTFTSTTPETSANAFAASGTETLTSSSRSSSSSTGSKSSSDSNAALSIFGSNSLWSLIIFSLL
ncbi:uncharacterized protein KGF55_003142 [Candida pseudojiufengensis]|uniref:uncharacterized protein n=1 Tax=Candida pseudojiufengensis TaxID=497109 RepID=UPI002224DEBB|nr:uncharacterized protein KGF55_003142 [Candida pseudojiufengensis]KAI5962067.1 hypothetical protein KGF55_003142 [Candida pseudojiufengensis]